MTLSQEMLEALLDALPEGVSLIDAGNGRRVAYANRAYARLAGVDPAALMGEESPLFSDAIEAAVRSQLEAAMAEAREARVLFRDRRPDGTSFWHAVQLQPAGPGPLKGHFLVLHRESGARSVTKADTATPEVIQRLDLLTGLSTQAWCEEMLARDCVAAAREQRTLTLFAIEIDALKRYGETFGRSGVDACERRVGRALAGSFRRASDCLAHWEQGRFLAVASAMTLEQATAHATTLLGRVRDLRVHHPRSTTGRYLTVSIGVVCGVPGREAGDQALLAAALAALRLAQGEGGDRLQGMPLPSEEPAGGESG